MLSDISDIFECADVILDENKNLSEKTYSLSKNYTDYKKVVFFYKYNETGTFWTTVAYPNLSNNINGFHLFSAYGAGVHDAYGFFNANNQMVVQGSISGTYPYLIKIVGFKTY